MNCCEKLFGEHKMDTSKQLSVRNLYILKTTETLSDSVHQVFCL